MDIGYTIKKGIKYVQHYGVRELITRMHEKQDSMEISYAEFCRQEKMSAVDLERQKTRSRSWSQRPLISVVCKTDRTDEVRESLVSDLASQTYESFECCVASSFSEAIQMAKGEYLAFVEAGDVLAPDALYEVVSAILGEKHSRQSGVHWEQHSCSPDLIYTDEDFGENYWMKPDFSPAMLEEICYIKHLLVVSKKLAAKCVLAEGDNDKSDFAMTLTELAMSCANQARYIYHIPKVLYHCMTENNSDERIELRTDRPEGVDNGEQPLISIIIPNKDQKDTLEQCLNSIRKSTYSMYEIIVVENNSTTKDIFDYYNSLTDAKVVRWSSDGSVFNYSAINNFGVSYAKGNYLVFLNNDIEIITPNWLEQLLEDCRRSNTAIAGAKLYYPDDTIQHAGIVIGVGGHARGIGANMCVGLDRTNPGYMNRASIRQNMSAVTAACMMMRRDVFEKVGGFTESLTVAFNDVDLCLKTRRAGYEIIFDPYVEAYHYESKSRGQENTEEKVRRFQTEIEYMRTEWEDILKKGDPYYNPNLSRYRFDYSLRRGK